MGADGDAVRERLEAILGEGDSMSARDMVVCLMDLAWMCRGPEAEDLRQVSDDVRATGAVLDRHLVVLDEILRSTESTPGMRP